MDTKCQMRAFSEATKAGDEVVDGQQSAIREHYEMDLDAVLPWRTALLLLRDSNLEVDTMKRLS